MTEKTVIFILAAPPLTSGERTLRRVALASSILGAERALVVNLFPLPTEDVLHISRIGMDAKIWLGGRPSLLAGLEAATDVVLAYGVSEPSGIARVHHRGQIEWLRTEIARLQPRLWAIGGAPRHPSRWQRHTSRSFPSLSFDEALAKSLQQISR